MGAPERAGRRVGVHLGLPKTGTTFLQRKIFPAWRQVRYIGGLDSVRNLVERADAPVVLVSDESLWFQRPDSGDPYWTEYGDLGVVRASLARIAGVFPGARAIVSLRRHSTYILSLYKQYLHQGGRRTLEEFFSLEPGEGLLRAEYIEFRPFLEAVEAQFGRPVLFLQGELRTSLAEVLGRIGAALGVPPPGASEIEEMLADPLDAMASNTGVAAAPAQVLRVLNHVSRSAYNPGGLLPLRSRLLTRLRLDPRTVCQSGIVAHLLPSKPLGFPDAVRQQVEERFAEDWSFVKERIAEDQAAG